MNYLDVEVLAEDADDDSYIIRIAKEDLNTLVASDFEIRHWNGSKPVLLETYGTNAVRTASDDDSDNNLSSLPNVSLERLIGFLNS